MSRFAFWGVLIAAIALLAPGIALAQDTGDPNTAVQGLLDIIQSQANSWDGRLKGYATTLFWSLAVIQFVITFFPLAIRSGDVSEIFGELIRFVLTIGFFAALMLHSREWASAIVDSFREAGATAGGLSDKALRPGDIFGIAVDFAQTIGDVETWNPLTAISVTLAALVVLLSFTFISALMFVTLVESYIVINASVLFMGFGGSSWTREYAIALLRYALSVGAKLFVLTLIVGVVLSSTKQWQAAYNADDTSSMWTMVGLGLICAYLAKTIPDMIQGLISGVSPGGGNMIGSMAMVGAAIATAGMSAASGALGAAAGGAAGGGAGGLLGGAATGSGGLASALSDGIASSATSTGSGGGGSPVAAASLGQRTGGGSSAPSAAPSAAAAPAAPSAPKGPAAGGSASPSGNGAAAQNTSQGPGGASDSKSQGGAGKSSSAETAQGSGNSAAAAQPSASANSSAASPLSEGESVSSGGAEPTGGAEGGSNEPSGRTGGAAPNAEGAAAQKGTSTPQQQEYRQSKGHLAAAGAVKLGGALAALAVPGMEGAASISLGPSPMKPMGAGTGSDGGDDSTSDFASGDTSAEADNVIAPASAPIVDPSAETTPGPSPAPPSEPNQGNGEGAAE